MKLYFDINILNAFMLSKPKKCERKPLLHKHFLKIKFYYSLIDRK